MLLKLPLLVLSLVYCDGVLYSSFWAPLFNPRILNFRVDAPFDPEAGVRDRDQYVKDYGFRGEKLIENLGNGKGPRDAPYKDKSMNDVRFYYTYPGASREAVNYNSIN